MPQQELIVDGGSARGLASSGSYQYRNKKLKLPPVIHGRHPNCVICCGGNEVVRGRRRERGGQIIPAENSEACEETLELNLNVMFFLKKVLELPTGLLKELLTKCGSPWRWIGLCDECQEFVKEAFALEVEMAKLNRRFRRIQLEIKEKMMACRGKVGAAVGNRSSPSIQFAREVTRKFVRGYEYTQKKNPFVQGDRFAETVATFRTTEVKNEADVEAVKDVEDNGGDEPMQSDELLGDSSSPEEEAESLLKPPNPVKKCVVKEADALVTSTGRGNRKGSLTERCDSSMVVLNCTNRRGGRKLQSRKLRKSTRNSKGSELLNSPNQTNRRDKPLPKSILLAIVQPATDANFGNSFTCPMCPSLSEMKFDGFIKHISFHKRRPYKCTECSVYLGHNHSIEGHWKVIHEDKQDVFPKFTEVSLNFGNLWKCGVCQEGFPTDLERTDHETAAHPEFKRTDKSCFTCGECSKSFDVLNEWRLHRALEHPEIATTSCLYCNEKFVLMTREGVGYLDTQRLKEHLKEAHGTSYKEYKSCDFCGEPFPQTSASAPCRLLLSHLTSIHGVPPDSALTCDFCEKCFGNHVQLRSHFKHSHKQQARVCHICGYGSSLGPLLKQHLLSKHGIRPKDERQVFKCSLEGCSFETVIQDYLRRHEQQHLPLVKRERRFTCSTCGKSFLHSKHCRRHEEIHQNSGTKPYQCEICGNSFAIKNYLYIHKRLSHFKRKFPSANKPKSGKKANQPFTTAAATDDEATGGIHNAAAVGVSINNEATTELIPKY